MAKETVGFIGLGFMAATHIRALRQVPGARITALCDLYSDQIDRANEQAANSLLKILEEPPDHLILVMTAENIYDLLPTKIGRAHVNSSHRT